MTLQGSRKEKIKYIVEEGKQGVVQINPIFRYDKLNGVEITQLEFKTKLLIQETYYFDEFTNHDLRLKKVEKIIGTQYILVDGTSETNPQPELIIAILKNIVIALLMNTSSSITLILIWILITLQDKSKKKRQKFLARFCLLRTVKL